MHSIPPSAPGMYSHNNNQMSCATNRAPSTALGASLESHMTEISKTMLQLAQAHEKIANTQTTKSSDHGNCPAAISRCF